MNCYILNIFILFYFLLEREKKREKKRKKKREKPSLLLINSQVGKEK